MQTFGLLECFIFSAVVLAAAGQLALGNSLYHKARGHRMAILLSPLALFACALVGLVLYYIPGYFLGVSMIDCCYVGTPLRAALAQRFLYDQVDTATLPLLVGLSILGLLALILSRFGAKALVPLIMGVAAILVGLWIGWFGGSANVLTDIVPEAPDVPIYPGSRDVVLDRDSSRWFNWHDISLKAPASSEAIAAFYKDVLPGSGWSLIKEGPFDGWLQFLRVDERTGSIWKYKLSIMPRGDVREANASETQVEMTATRYPNLDKLPTHPDATDVMMSSDVVRGVYTVTYGIEVSPKDVLQWYRSTLDSYGWWAELGDESLGDTGAHFGYVTYGVRVVDLYLVVMPTDEKHSRVDVRAVAQPEP